jgi:hypothetical protein
MFCLQAVMEQREARKAAAAEGADGRNVSVQALLLHWLLAILVCMRT